MSWNAQTERQACEWFVEFRTGEPDAAARRAFHAWLQESPGNMSAYLKVTALWNEGGAVDRAGKWSEEALLAQACTEGGEVVSLGRSGDSLAVQARKSRAYWFAAAATVLLAIGGVVTWQSLTRDSYRTAVGEQRSISLADGSTVMLNSRSQVRVRYSNLERDVELIDGQALFTVARDASRPFLVMSGATRVRAIGTQFDVYRRKDATTVTVLEGRVAVLPESSAAQEGAVLSAGEQTTVGLHAATVRKRVSAPTAVAWTQRQLVFESTPLSQVIEEFNRYNARQLEIVDPKAEGLQIDGVFSSTDPTSLIRFLRERPDIEVTEHGSRLVIASRK